MASKIDRVLITGTTSGVGGALLEHYVALGARVVSVNRRRVPELESRYPGVRFECLDVRNAAEVERLLDNLASSMELPEVFILNAGINLVDNDAAFQLEAYRVVVDTNLYGVVNFVEPLTRCPADGRIRHLVAIGSMANYVGNPYALGYQTSKRALARCFDVWSRMYTGTDLVFQQVLLGPVKTPMYTMASDFPAWMVWIRDLFSASVSGSAAAVARLARTRRRRQIYPWRAIPLYLGMRLCKFLIPGFFCGRKTLDGRARRTKLEGERSTPKNDGRRDELNS
jgi:NAD(P)-dependent dehydrogenase (short-subunit alcohol dehydrogenase family)